MSALERWNFYKCIAPEGFSFGSDVEKQKMQKNAKKCKKM